MKKMTSLKALGWFTLAGLMIIIIGFQSVSAIRWYTNYSYDSYSTTVINNSLWSNETTGLGTTKIKINENINASIVGNGASNGDVEIKTKLLNSTYFDYFVCNITQYISSSGGSGVTSGFVLWGTTISNLYSTSSSATETHIWKAYRNLTTFDIYRDNI
jgi:hypothetical protein